MARKIVYMKDQEHNASRYARLNQSDAPELVKEVAEVLKKVELSEETPAEIVKPFIKKKKRRTQAQMKAAKDDNVQATD